MSYSFKPGVSIKVNGAPAPPFSPTEKPETAGVATQSADKTPTKSTLGSDWELLDPQTAAVVDGERSSPSVSSAQQKRKRTPRSPPKEGTRKSPRLHSPERSGSPRRLSPSANDSKLNVAPSSTAESSRSPTPTKRVTSNMAAAAIAEPTVKQTTNSSRTFGSGFATTATTFSALAANTKPAAIAYGKQEEGVEGEASPKTTSVSGNIFSDSAASATAEPSAFTASEENEQQQVSLQQLANIPTGEEDETTVFRSRGQLKVYDSAGKEWRQRGAGQLRLNMRGQPPTDLSARLIMRNTGTMGLILNVSLFDGMQFKLTGERTIIFGAVDPHQQKVVTYAIKFENAQLAQDALECLQMASSKEQARHLLNIEQDYGEYERYLQEQAASEQQQYYDEQDDASSGQDEEDESD